MISHPACLGHDTGADHPECARRLSAINDRFVMTGLADVLRHYDAPEVTQDQLLRVHTQHHLDRVASMIPETGYGSLDPDTIVSNGSLAAARRAAGAVVKAVDLVSGGEMETAFCCVRPPGHHAESERAMGFCLYNNIAVGGSFARMKESCFARRSSTRFIRLRQCSKTRRTGSMFPLMPAREVQNSGRR
jgi:acetoin utilization deacetylase AcuC-like enzyme